MRRAVPPIRRRASRRSILTDKLGQQVLVDNKQGGGTIIGTEIVAKAKPDGYTILLAPGACRHQHVVRPEAALRSGEGSGAGRAATSTCRCCSPAIPGRALQDDGRADRLGQDASCSRSPCASAGNATHARISGASSFKIETGIKLEHIGYKGSADALKDVLGGHVMLFSDTLLP